MSDADIAILGASKLEGESKSALWQTIVPITDDTEDTENLGDLEVYQALGVTSAPWPKDDKGYAEAVVLRDCGGRSAVCVGARDTRSAAIVGRLKPGDTVVHSTGPQQAAQLQLKEAKRQAALLTLDSSKETMAVILDGKNDKLQVIARGAIFEIAKNGDISLANAGGASFLLQGGDVYINGNVHLNGIPPGMVLMAGPPAGDPTGVAPLFPVLGVGK